jgi:hypothetical protein
MNGVPPPGTPLTFTCVEYEWGYQWECRYTGTDTPVGYGDDKPEAYEHLLRTVMRQERDG